MSNEGIIPVDIPGEVVASGLLEVVRVKDCYAIVLTWDDPAEGARRIPLMVLARDTCGLWFAARTPDRLGFVGETCECLTLHDAVRRQTQDYKVSEGLAAAITALVSTVRPAPAR